MKIFLVVLFVNYTLNYTLFCEKHYLRLSELKYYYEFWFHRSLNVLDNGSVLLLFSRSRGIIV